MKDLDPFTMREQADQERIAQLEARIAELEAELRTAQKLVTSFQAERETVVALWKDQKMRELEAANVICRTDIEALMRSADSLEARNTELEAERDRLTFALHVIAAGETTDPAAMARAALSDPSGE